MSLAEREHLFRFSVDVFIEGLIDGRGGDKTLEGVRAACELLRDVGLEWKMIDERRAAQHDLLMLGVPLEFAPTIRTWITTQGEHYAHSNRSLRSPRVVRGSGGRVPERTRPRPLR